ncbi:binding-protein-dependent transport systems inner membrane component [Syntrophobotulus glycolicus DSM 8271]|uniref:Binding-protein-dependent transport systems inner membrane component n=1 Tax=Syntrophobotulus glycolicus (strain DSM 8271 / FlGlyR) TaxID=645991 RepID=F0SZN0_SYNGF|nr:binding-protein-dependent transport systems inner membrane component [Syntrophobotulus glycolicus DSM 8271]
MTAIFIIKRACYLLLVLFCISFLSFLLANISPVDPAEAYARHISMTASEQSIEKYREEMGFHRSVPEQYLSWLGQVVRLDFGSSYITKKPVLQEMETALPTTLLIAGSAAVFILVLAVPLGILSSHDEGKIPDKIIGGLSFLSVSIPSYFVGLLFLMLFGMKLHLFPVIGHGNLVSIIFAAFVLALPMIGSLIRILRSLLLENREKEYIQYAKARGISKKNIMVRHLLRNAAPSCITMFGQNIGYLIAGTAIVETIFSTPGLGQYALTAAFNRDFPVINGYIVLMALFFVLCNLSAEIISTLLNPSLRRDCR